MKSISKTPFERNPLAISIIREVLTLGGVLAGQLLLASTATAAPVGESIVGGSGSVSRYGTTTKVRQTSERLAINWDSFNVDVGERVKFVQPSSSSLVLNRILDQNPSEIRGSIDARGNVLLVNPRGIMFTEGATVNVGGLVASGLDVSVNDFMNGHTIFKGLEGEGGAVINQGVINASSAALVGKSVSNGPGAVISAKLVKLAAGDEALLTFDAEGLMGVKVTKEVLENDLGLDAAVLNAGKINGQKVLLEASVSKGLFSNAVNNEGVITAQGIDVSGGTIRLFGSGGGVSNSGELLAAGTAGGEIDVQGGQVVNTGTIEAAGISGNGEAIQIDAMALQNSGVIDSGSGGMTISVGGEGVDSHNALGSVHAADMIVVNARGGADDTDSFVFSAGKEYALEDTGVVLTQGMAISGADLIDAGDEGVLQGRAGVAESFTITGSKVVQTNDITFANITEVNAGTGGDSVTGASEWSLNGANSVKAQGITFTDIEKVTSTGAGRLSGQENVAESFVITGSQALVASGIAFDNIAVVNAGVGAEMDSVTGAEHWMLNGAKSVSAQGMTFTDIEQVRGEGLAASLTGGDSVAESFVITGSKALTANDIAFDNISMVRAGVGNVNDSVIGAAHWVLNGVKSVKAQGITFSEIEQVGGAGIDGSITGRDNVAESFLIDGKKTLTVNEMAFSNVTAVNAGAGTAVDSVSGAEQWALNGRKSVVAGGITFTDIEQVSGAGTASTIIGRNDAADAFAITGSKALKVNDIAFDNISTVKAGNSAGADRVTGGGQWVLNGNQSVKAQDMTFTGIEQIGSTTDNSEVIGSGSMAETFILTGDNRLTVSDMDFVGVAAVVGQAADRVQDGGDLSYELYTETEARVANLHLQGLTLSNIDWGDGDSLTVADQHGLSGKTIDSKGAQVRGSEAADAFDIRGANAVHYRDVEFTNVTRVDALHGQDTVTGATEWALQGSKSVQAEGIIFSNVDHAGSLAVASQVTGRNHVAESFAITGNKALSVDGIAFTNVTAVDAGTGTTADRVTGTSEWALQGGHSLRAEGISFTGIEQAGSADLASRITGQNNVAEAFAITGTKALSVDGIAFTNITGVDAGNGETLDQVTGATEWSLQGSHSVNAAGIAFRDIEQAGSAGLASRVIGQDNVAESFVLTGEKSLSVDDIDFENITGVNAGNGSGIDSVTGADEWQLAGHQRVTAAGVAFSEVEQVTSTGAGKLAGQNNVAESFTITGSKSLTTSGIAFDNIAMVNAGAGTATDSVTGSAEWQLQSAKSLSAHDINFIEIEQAGDASVESRLSGRDDVAESFAITGNKALSVAGIAFTNVTTVDAGSGTVDDQVTGASEWVLQGSRSVSAEGISFTGVEQAGSAATASTLTGRDDIAETFVISGHKALHVDDIAFTNITAVEAGSGATEDQVTGATEWALQGRQSVKANGITFTDIEQAGSVGLAGRIVGQNHVAESFVITAEQTLSVEGIAFENITQVNAGSGSATDSVTGVAKWQLSGHQSVEAAGVVFTEIEKVTSTGAGKLTGQDNVAESFIITGNKSLNTKGIAFDNIAEVNAGAGTATDSVTGTAKWQLQGNKSISAQDIVFTDIEQAGDASIESWIIARDDVAESFAITGHKALNVDGIDFTNITAVDAGGGSTVDQVTGATEWALQGSHSLSAEGIAFTDIERAGSGDRASRIIGQNDVAESFDISGHQALSVDGIAFANIIEVNAGNGSAADSVTGAGEWQLTRHQSVTAAGVAFSEIEQAISTGAGKLTGRNDVAESFVINGDRALSVDGISFANITTVNAGSGAGIDRVSGASEWWLNGSQSVKAQNITFAGIERVDSAGSTGSVTGRNNVGETFTLTGHQAFNVDNIDFTKIAVVNAGSGAAGDRAVGASEWLLKGKHSVTAQNIFFTGIEQAGGAERASRITGQDGVAEAFLITGHKAVTVDGIQFDNIQAVSAGTGVGNRVESAAAVEWQLSGEQRELAAKGIAFAGIDTVQHAAGVVGYSSIAGSDKADTFVISGSNEIIANGVQVKNIDRVDGQGQGNGRDLLTSHQAEAWQLSTDVDVQVEHSGIHFKGLEEVQGAMGSSLMGTSGDDYFAVETAANTVTRDQLMYSNITLIDAGAGDDTLSADQGHIWQLTDTAKQLVANGVTYKSIDTVIATDASIKGRDDVVDRFEIGAVDRQVKTQGLTFNSVAHVDGGAGAGDTVISHTHRDWQLTADANTLQAAGITFSAIEAAAFGPSVSTLGALTGSAADETFDISGKQRNAVLANGIAFTEIGTVDARGGHNRVVSADTEHWSLTGVNGQVSSDDIHFSGVQFAGSKIGSSPLSSLQGSRSDETYVIDAASNTVAVAGISFDHLGAIDAGGGQDRVQNLRETAWRAVEQGSGLVERSAEALVNSIWVLFANIEKVMNTGTYSGPSVGADYTLTDTHAVRVGGIGFEGVSSIHAGAGVDTLHGLDLDTDWTLNGRSGSTQYLNFSGIDTIRAGSASDVFTFKTGVSGNVFTGEGNDTVYLNGGSVAGLHLQGGADRVFLNSAASSATMLDGGTGNDSLTSNLANLTWQITGGLNHVNHVGDYAFTGFENLINGVDRLQVKSASAASFNVDHIEFHGLGMNLGYKAVGDIQFTSYHQGSDALTGTVTGGSLDVVTAGGVDLKTNIDRLSILNHNNRSIHVSVREADDLVVGQIHAGAGGTISLTSMGMGALMAETRGVTHLTADTVNLGAEWQRWSAIGEQLNPLRMDVGRAVNIVALSYVEPEFVNGIPSLTATGNRLQSVTGAVASQGMKSAVQTNVEEFTQVDPAIFTPVSSYSVNSEALNAPEFALIAGELIPAQETAEASGEVDRERAALTDDET